MHTPILTIALQTYNCEATVEAALRSILTQSFTNYELLVHDDGSVDDTVEVISSLRDSRITLFTSDKNLGRASRLNQAIHRARGKYFAVLDGDDISFPERLARSLDFLDRHRDVDLVGGSMLVFGGAGIAKCKRTVPTSHDAICRRPQRGILMAHPTVCGHLNWFKKWHYNEEMRRVEDQELLLRAFAHSRFANLTELLVGYRVAEQIASKERNERRWFIRALRRQAGRGSLSRISIHSGIVQQWIKMAIPFALSIYKKALAARCPENTKLTVEELTVWRRLWEKCNRQLPSQNDRTVHKDG